MPQDTTDNPAKPRQRCTASPATGHERPWLAEQADARRRARDRNRIGYGIGYDPATGAAGGTGGMPEMVLGSTGGQEELLGRTPGRLSFSDR